MEYNWTKIDFSPGRVEWIETYKQEDMLQVIFPRGYILDMGWYECLYKIYIIQNNDWINPICFTTTDCEDELMELLSQFKAKVINLIS